LWGRREIAESGISSVVSESESFGRFREGNGAKLYGGRKWGENRRLGEAKVEERVGHLLMGSAGPTVKGY